MNIVLLTAKDFIARDRALLADPRRVEHILLVHKAQIGDSLKLGMINGSWGQGKILALDNREILLGNIVLDQLPPAPLPLTLLLGLPRPKMLKRIFQTVATLGVKKIYLINSYRVEKSYWQTPWLTPEAILSQLVLGLEQGCDTRLPDVTLVKRFKPFVEDELPTLLPGSRALVAHPYAELACPAQTSEVITLAVGPEGGFIPYEIKLLEQCGFETVHLGERIMRVETAVPYLIGRLYG